MYTFRWLCICVVVIFEHLSCGTESFFVVVVHIGRALDLVTECCDCKPGLYEFPAADLTHHMAAANSVQYWLTNWYNVVVDAVTESPARICWTLTYSITVHRPVLLLSTALPSIRLLCQVVTLTAELVKLLVSLQLQDWVDFCDVSSSLVLGLVLRSLCNPTPHARPCRQERARW